MENKTGDAISAVAKRQHQRCGIFASLQSGVLEEHFGSVDDLVEEVKRVFYESDLETLERV